jgi:hypothetical protein
MNRSLTYLFGILLLAGGCQRRTENKADNTENIDSVALLRRQTDSLSLLLRRQNNQGTAAAALNHSDSVHLVRQGLTQPTRLLLEDLSRHPEVIPDSAVLGGTMHFTMFRLLNRQWAMAAYEDGHVAGQMLLRFTVAPGSRISWQVIDASMD